MDKERIRNISGNEYFNACAKCGSTSNLCQYAHRNSNGQIIGWLFSCPNCKDKISGQQINAVFGYRKPKDKPPLLSDNPYLYFGSPHSIRDTESNVKHIAFKEGKQAQRELDIKHYEGGE